MNDETIELEVVPPRRRTARGHARSRTQGRSRAGFRLLLLLIAGAIAGVFAYEHWQRRGEYVPLGSRTEFSANACVEYGPSASNSGPIVFIDPGHGGPDPGVEGQTTAGSIVMEKTETLAVSLNLMRRLTSAGYRVALSRVADTSVVGGGAGLVSNGSYTLAGEHADIEARIDCANAAHASLLLSIHFNGFTDPSVGGTATIYDDARPFTPQNQRFANLVQQSVLAAWTNARITIPDRGVTADSEAGTPALTNAGAEYGHLLLLGPAAPDYLANPSAMPGALSEPLFLTDGPEASLADSSEGRRLLATAYTSAINAYFQRHS